MMNSSENAVYDVALGYQKTAALIAAVKLDIFTLIGNGNITPDVLSFKTGASVRGLRILCDYLTVIGLLSKRELSYSLSPAARRYLDRSSPAAMGSCIAFLAAPEMISLLLDDPVSYVRHGGSKGLANLAPDHPIWVRFAHAMIPFAAPTAKLLATYVASLPEKPRTVLDIAAGHGLYGIEVAKLLPQAVVTAVDWAEVLSVARMNAGGRWSAGSVANDRRERVRCRLGTRFRSCALGKFFTSFGSGRDASYYCVSSKVVFLQQGRC